MSFPTIWGIKEPGRFREKNNNRLAYVLPLAGVARKLCVCVCFFFNTVHQPVRLKVER